jgi:hypothetical protein
VRIAQAGEHEWNEPHWSEPTYTGQSMRWRWSAASKAGNSRISNVPWPEPKRLPTVEPVDAKVGVVEREDIA